MRNLEESLGVDDLGDSAAKGPGDLEVGNSKDSKVDDAIADVTWVIDNLVSFLSAEAIGVDTPSHPDSDSDSDSDSALNSRAAPPPKRKQSKPVKVGPPTKRTRRTRHTRS